MVRGTEWRVCRSTAFDDCQTLDLEHGASAVVRTLLLPFDRPRIPARPPLVVVSRRRWAREVCEAVASSFPYGGLRFCPPAIRLMAYQLEPALALLRCGATRVLIADGVGLGKTVEAGLVIRELAMGDRDARVLILCPAPLRAQWAEEMVRLFDVTTVDADARWLRLMARTLPADVNPWSLPAVYVASVDFVKRPEALRPLEDVRWDLLVVDEAHVATCGSDRHAAVAALADRARRLVLLTATPHSGDDDAFRALCALGRAGDDPLFLFSRDRPDTPLGPSRLRSRVLAVRPGDAERQLHRLLDDYARRLWAISRRPGRRGTGLLATVLSKRALSSPVSLAISLARRRALLAQTDSPPFQIPLPLDDELVEDEASDAVLRERGLDDPEEEGRVLDTLADTAARAGRAERKLQALLRLLRRLREPVLVFSEFRDSATHLHGALTAAGHDVALLHGGMSDEERRRAAARLVRGEAHLVATDAASEGLNLHRACRIVVHFELPWTPSRLRQRCGRVDRIGQTRPVHEIALVACDTSEHLVLAPLLARAGRVGPLARHPLMERISESHVSAYVLGGVPVTPSPLEPLPGTARVDLRDEADAEVARLEQLRRLDTAARRTRLPARRGGIVPATVLGHRRLHMPRGLHLVFSLRVRAETGPPLLQEVVVLSADLLRAPVRRGPRAAVQEDLRDAIRRIDGALTAVMRRLAADRVRAVRPRHEEAARRLLERQRHADAGLSSAAQELVQAGLFDRRALRARAARERAAAARRDDDRARLPTRSGATLLDGGYELLAVLVGGGA